MTNGFEHIQKRQISHLRNRSFGSSLLTFNFQYAHASRKPIKIQFVSKCPLAWGDRHFRLFFLVASIVMRLIETIWPCLLQSVKLSPMFVLLAKKAISTAISSLERHSGNSHWIVIVNRLPGYQATQLLNWWWLLATVFRRTFRRNVEKVYYWRRISVEISQSPTSNWVLTPCVSFVPLGRQ